MPELPEVETVTQSVKKHIMGKRFSSLDVNWRKVLDNFTLSIILIIAGKPFNFNKTLFGNLEELTLA